MSHHSPLIRHNLVRLGAAALIPEMLQEQGISPEAALSHAGFSWHLFEQPELVLPLNRLGRIVKAAAMATTQPEFGLLIGLRAGSRLMELGLGSMPNDSRVSGALMQLLSRSLSFPNAFLTLAISSGTCTVSCAALPRNIVAGDLLSDCAMGFAAGALRFLCGPRWRPSGFRFTRGASPHPCRYAALLQAPVSFDATVTAMEFKSSWLKQKYNDQQDDDPAKVYSRKLHEDVVSEVRRTLITWNSVDKLSAPAVAGVLGLQPRTLNRLLNKTGTNFNRMLRDTQFQAAQTMLRDPALPIVWVAWSLGYVDASAFSRAFRRWSGTTPTKWREQTERERLRTPKSGVVSF